MPGLLRAQRRVRPRQPRRCGRRSTATSGCSTARRSGRRPATSPTTSSRSPAPIPTRPKHKGISFLLVDMRQPGIEVRPIKMISGRERVQRGLLHRRRVPEGRRRRRRQQRLGGGDDPARLRARRGGGDDADPLPGRARPAARCWPRSAASTDDPLIRQRLAWCYGKVQIMRYLGMRTLTQFLAGHHPGPDGGDHQAVLERVPPGRHRARRRHPRRRRADADRAPAVERVPDRRRRRAELVGVVGRHVPQRPGRHDLRRVVADPAQHHRRDGARAAEGAEGSERERDRAIARRRRGRATRACGRSALRQWRRTVPPGWWRRRAVPARAADRSTSRFRLLTQYGDTEADASTPPMW